MENILNQWKQYKDSNATAKTIYECVAYQLPKIEDSYYDSTYYETYSNFLGSNRKINRILRNELNTIIAVKDLHIGGATATLFPANYLQGVTQAQAILNYDGSICFAYLVEFDGTNTTYKSIRVNSSNEVVGITNSTAVITSDDEMIEFLTVQIESSIAVLPE
jgi:hypothetical protein